MSHQHISRNQTPKGPVVKEILQYAFFAIACIWLLYQVQGLFGVKSGNDCADYAERQLTERHTGGTLGRKGAVGSSHNAQELELYGTDLVREAEKIKHGSPGGNDSNESNNVEGKGEEEPSDTSPLEEFSDKGEIPPHNEADTPVGDSSQTIIPEKLSDEEEELRKMARIEVKPVVSIDAVILKSDENGVLKRDSAPSRRSDIQVQNMLQGDTLSSGNQSREMRARDQICVQNSTKKQSLKKFQAKADHEKAAELMAIESGETSRRELLSTDRRLNTTGF